MTDNNNASTSDTRIPDVGILPVHCSNNSSTVILAKKECPFCEVEYGTFQKARLHIYRKHNKNIEKRGSKDHGSGVYVYNQKNIEKFKNKDIGVIVKFACMSCNSTFNTKSELALHIDQLHILEGSPAEQLPADNHWIIQEDDVSEKFYQYRCFCIEKSKTTNLALEENFNEILSMSGILVLQKRNDYQVIPKSIFSPELLQEMRSNIMNSYQRECFNPVLFSRLNTIIQQYNNDDISETQTKIRLLTLSEEANENERSVICAIVELIPNLYDCNMKTLSEAHLAASFVHPFIHGLLSSKQPSKVAHCSNVVADENKDTNNRPDYKVDIYAQEYRYSYTNAYGEIKPSSNVSPTLLVNDFYRLAIFSKDAIDAFNLNQVLSFQVIGSCITFFSMSLSYHHLYTYTELARLHIPTKKSDLLNLIGHLDNLVFISLVHKNFCQPSDVDLFELSCDTLSSSYLENPKETMATRKRHCSLTIDN